MPHPPLAEPPEMTPETTETTEKPVTLSPKGGRWRWLLLGAVLLAGGGGYYWWSSAQGNGSAGGPPMMGQMPPPAVKWQVIKPGQIQSSSVLMGSLEAPKGTEITPEVEGRVEAILVKEGQRVSAGQTLFRLDDDLLQSELFTAQAGLAQAQAELSELQAGSRPEDIAAVQARLQQVKTQLADAQAGAPLEEIAQAQAQLVSAKATAELANERVRRFSQLREEGVVALDTYDEQVNNQRQALAEVQVAQRRLAERKKGRQSEVTRLTAAVEAETQALRWLENGERPEKIAQAKARVAQAQAEINTLKTRLAKTRVVAPFAGVMGYIPIKLGEFVQAGDRLTSLTENQQLTLNLSVPIAQASQLQTGLPVEVLDAQGEAIARSRVSFISPDVDSEGQSVLARANFSNPSADLLNRQLVEARLIWRQFSGLTVPTAAISRLGGETFVFVAVSQPNEETGKPELVAEQRSVTLGEIQDNRYEVKAGLQAGDKVITAGLLKIQDGTVVHPQESESFN